MTHKSGECKCSKEDGGLDKYLLAVIWPMAKENPLFKAFLESLPKCKQTKIDSRGYLSGKCFSGREEFDFLLLSARDFSGVNKEFFADLFSGSIVFEIDHLNFNAYFKQKGKNKEVMSEHISGMVYYMLRCY